MTTMSASNFSAFSKEGIDVVWNASGQEYRKEWPIMFTEKQIRKESDKSQAYYTLGLWSETVENQNYATDQGGQGPSAFFVPKQYSSGYAISEIAVEDGLYWDYVGVFTRALQRTGYQTQDILAIDYINNWATNLTADGQPLFSVSHVVPKTNGTTQNRLTNFVDLSVEGIKAARIQVQKMLSLEGLITRYEEKDIWGSFELEDIAKEVLKTPLTPYQNVNTINVAYDAYPFKGLRYLTNPKMWGMNIKNVEKGFVFYTRVPLNIKNKYIDPENGATKVHGRTRFTVGMTDWHCSFLCNG